MVYGSRAPGADSFGQMVMEATRKVLGTNARIVPRIRCFEATLALERHTNRELQLPREVRLAVDLSEGAARYIRLRRIEIRCIEGVERFSSELRLHSFAKGEVLEDGDVPICLGRTAQIAQTAGRVAESSRRQPVVNAAGLM